MEAGLSPYEALEAGTRIAALVLVHSNDFGTVTPGKRADLLLLDANPLKDVTNASKIGGVMVRGRWLPQGELQSILDGLKDSFEPSLLERLAVGGMLAGRLRSAESIQKKHGMNAVTAIKRTAAHMRSRLLVSGFGRERLYHAARASAAGIVGPGAVRGGELLVGLAFRTLAWLAEKAPILGPA